MYTLLEWLGYKLHVLGDHLFMIVDKHHRKMIGKAIENGDIEINESAIYIFKYALKIMYNVYKEEDYMESYEQELLKIQNELELENKEQAAAYYCNSIVQLSNCNEALSERIENIVKEFVEKYHLEEVFS